MMSTQTNLSRRRFLRWATAGLLSVGVMGGGSYQYGFNVEPHWLTVERVTVPVQRLGSQFAGFKIVQLSDLHLQPFTQLDLIARAVELVNSLQPDLVVLTGDYVLSTAESIFDLAPALSKMQPREGIVAIVGNHDLWTNVGVVQQGFRESNIPVLVNEHLVLTRGGQHLTIAGLDDGWSGRPDLRTALMDVPTTAAVVLLMHEPDYIDQFSLDERVVLQLSGHTHGGQVRLPLWGAFVLPRYGRKYQAGLYQVNGCWLYTNRGLGVIGPPVRINCPPEITEITLV